jgi:hypothetical protein
LSRLCVGSTGDRSYTAKASDRLSPHSKESLKAESLDEFLVRAHQPIEVGTLGKRGEGICKVGLGVALEVPLAGVPRPAGEEGEGDHLAHTERDTCGAGFLGVGVWDWQKSSSVT